MFKNDNYHTDSASKTIDEVQNEHAQNLDSDAAIPHFQPVYNVECDEENVRLDKFLAQELKHLSRTQIKGLIESGSVSDNEAIITNPASKTKNTTYYIDTSSIGTRPSTLQPYNFPLDIIFEDEYLLVINKPSGLTVHPGAGNFDQTLANALVAYSKDNLSKIGGEFRPGIVHRLDKDTSGLIIVAKDDHTHQLLSDLLSERSIKRYYLALVMGTPELMAGTIKTFVAKHHHDHTKMVVTRSSGKEAITHYVLAESSASNKFSLLECKLDTGRTHQIRIHLNYKNLPVIGDPVYNESQAKYLSRMPSEIKSIVSNFSRQALHAYKLEFIHPILDEVMEFEIDLPNDMSSLWEKLKNF